MIRIVQVVTDIRKNFRCPRFDHRTGDFINIFKRQAQLQTSIQNDFVRVLLDAVCYNRLDIFDDEVRLLFIVGTFLGDFKCHVLVFHLVSLLLHGHSLV
ncbi:hypothetical protein D3C73_1270290 [compost metagenome]